MVRFENVGLRYSLGPEVLRDVSFELAPRSFQFLTGPSGAGKTTLLRSINHLEEFGLTSWIHDVIPLNKCSCVLIRWLIEKIVENPIST